MRTKIQIFFLIITVSFLPSICKAKSVNPIFLTTTIIERISKERPKGVATGFFYESDNNLYIVTNKHVIYGKKFYEENSNPEIDQIKIILHTNKNDLRDNEEITIDLFNNEKKVWIEHDQKEYDVILIPIEVDRNKYVLKSTNRSNIDSDNIVIAFEKIFVMGYPFGWHDKIHNLPIVRVGHLNRPGFSGDLVT
jgi:S1-C subfamily serine protease